MDCHFVKFLRACRMVGKGEAVKALILNELSK